MAWAMLGRGPERAVHAGREPEQTPAPSGDEPPVSKEGYAEEALPWLDAVYRFAIRLTRGDRDAAEDLVQETFLRAHRFWHTFERGTNAKSWLFTICRNTYLHQQERVHAQRERPITDVGVPIDVLAAEAPLHQSSPDASHDFFHGLIDDEVLGAIDALPDEFREVLVLSDLGDLKYAEIADVLHIPLGTVKSRLFRARRILAGRLRQYAARTGYVDEDST